MIETPRFHIPWKYNLLDDFLFWITRLNFSEDNNFLKKNFIYLTNL